MSGILQDLRYGLRGLRKQPPFTMLAVMPVLEFGSLPRRKTEDASAVNVLHPS